MQLSINRVAQACPGGGEACDLARASLELGASAGYSGVPPSHPPQLSSAPLHTAAEMGNSAMSIQVTFQAGAKLSSLGPGLQQRAPKNPYWTRVSRQTAHLGPAGKQAFPFCFTGKFELSKTGPTPAAIWILHSPAAKFRVQVTQNSSWRSLPKYWGFIAFKRGASVCSARQMRLPRSVVQAMH